MTTYEKSNKARAARLTLEAILGTLKQAGVVSDVAHRVMSDIAPDPTWTVILFVKEDPAKRILAALNDLYPGWTLQEYKGSGSWRFENRPDAMSPLSTRWDDIKVAARFALPHPEGVQEFVARRQANDRDGLNLVLQTASLDNNGQPFYAIQWKQIAEDEGIFQYSRSGQECGPLWPLGSGEEPVNPTVQELIDQLDIAEDN